MELFTIFAAMVEYGRTICGADLSFASRSTDCSYVDADAAVDPRDARIWDSSSSCGADRSLNPSILDASIPVQSMAEASSVVGIYLLPLLTGRRYACQLFLPAKLTSRFLFTISSRQIDESIYLQFLPAKMSIRPSIVQSSSCHVPCEKGLKLETSHVEGLA